LIHHSINRLYLLCGRFTHKNIEKIGIMIHYTSDPFTFTDVSLSQPTATQGGTFFSKISNKGGPLYIYSPICHTPGLVKQYVDFLFTRDDSFVKWIETLEEQLQTLIFERRNAWFVTDKIDLDDIQHAFMSILKFKGSQYTVRGHLPSKKQPWKDTLQVYDEDEISLPITAIKDSSVISILDIHGINFSDKSFQVVIHVRQIMVLKQSIFSECRIKIKESTPVDVSDSIVIPSIKELPNSE
jgi:hypothetical protein